MGEKEGSNRRGGEGKWRGVGNGPGKGKGGDRGKRKGEGQWRSEGKAREEEGCDPQLQLIGPPVRVLLYWWTTVGRRYHSCPAWAYDS